MVRRTRRFISPNLILCFSGWRNRHCLQRTVPSSHHRQGRPHRVCWAYGGTRQPSLEWRHAHHHIVVRHVAYNQVPIIAAHAGRRFQRTIPCMCPSFHCSASLCIAWGPPCFTAKLCRVASILAPSALCTICSQAHRTIFQLYLQYLANQKASNDSISEVLASLLSCIPFVLSTR